jgi:hypothetical protein
MVAHPAKFSDNILAVIYDLIPNKHDLILDPFAGTGKVHSLGLNTVGIELEPEWANMHPQTRVGNALCLPFEDGKFDGVITSPVYANRMSDSHDAKEKCKHCDGTGWRNSIICSKCEGKGFREYKRLTYTHQLGSKLHKDNSGQFQWGPKYIYFTVDTWIEILRVLNPERSWIILNVSDHIRDGKIPEVSQFHFDVLESLGMKFVKLLTVRTPRMKFGANGKLRVDHENIALFERKK